jgi:hypothetical protein
MFYCSVFVIAAAGITSFVLSYFSKKTQLPLGIFGILSVALVAVFLHASIRNSVEINPVFEESDILGDWEDSDSQLRLSQDGKLSFKLAPRYSKKSDHILSGEGSWAREGDFNIRIVTNIPMNFSLYMRVIQFNGNYRIIHEDFEDFDEWDHHLGFQRKQ